MFGFTRSICSRSRTLAVESLERRAMLTGGLGPDFGEPPTLPLITGGCVHAVPLAPFLPPPVVHPHLLPNPSVIPDCHPSTPFIPVEYEPLSSEAFGSLKPVVGKWLPR